MLAQFFSHAIGVRIHLRILIFFISKFYSFPLHHLFGVDSNARFLETHGYKSTLFTSNPTEIKEFRWWMEIAVWNREWEGQIVLRVSRDLLERTRWAEILVSACSSASISPSLKASLSLSFTATRTGVSDEDISNPIWIHSYQNETESVRLPGTLEIMIWWQAHACMHAYLHRTFSAELWLMRDSLVRDHYIKWDKSLRNERPRLTSSV